MVKQKKHKKNKNHCLLFISQTRRNRDKTVMDVCHVNGITLNAMEYFLLIFYNNPLGCSFCYFLVYIVLVSHKQSVLDIITMPSGTRYGVTCNKHGSVCSGWCCFQDQTQLSTHFSLI